MACTTERSTALGDLAAGRLDADGAGELLDHVEGCLACSEEWDLVAGLVAAAEERGADFLAAPARAARRPGPWLPLVAAAAVLATIALWMADLLPGGRAPRDPARLAALDPVPAPRSVLRSGSDALDAAFGAALERYRAGDFAGAATALAELAASLDAQAPSRPLVLLYLGIARLQTGRLAEAVSPLDEAARSGAGLVRERALWYLANARLAAGDAEAALRELRALEALGGDYELNAREQAEAIEAALGR